MKGIFISFEGIEGTGKSTQAKLLSQWLFRRKFEVVLTEEPGGTQIGLRIRDLLLSIEHKDMTPLTELLLYNSSRAQHLHQVIAPAIRRGAVVITDRFFDSTVAYQGYGRGIDRKFIDYVDRMVTGNMRPDLTILLDLDVETGLKRNRGINKTDRLELEDLEFHRRVRSGYHEIAAGERERIRLIDASGGIEETQDRIVGVVTDFIRSYGTE
jgi:dTMP kinase